MIQKKKPENFQQLSSSNCSLRIQKTTLYYPLFPSYKQQLLFEDTKDYPLFPHISCNTQGIRDLANSGRFARTQAVGVTDTITAKVSSRWGDGHGHCQGFNPLG
ncbi:unnamed protein product [Camellia sinensis]